MTQNDQVSTSSIPIDEQIVDKQHNKSNSTDTTNKETADTTPPELQQSINENKTLKMMVEPKKMLIKILIRQTQLMELETGTCKLKLVV